MLVLGHPHSKKQFRDVQRGLPVFLMPVASGPVKTFQLCQHLSPFWFSVKCCLLHNNMFPSGSSCASHLHKGSFLLVSEFLMAKKYKSRKFWKACGFVHRGICKYKTANPKKEIMHQIAPDMLSVGLVALFATNEDLASASFPHLLLASATFCT